MIFETIRKIISEQLSIDESEITLETNMTTDLEADSLDAVEIIMAIEDEYEIEIPDERVEEFTSITQLVDFVESLTQA